MAAKKKTNYISYELKKLEVYLEQLQSYLDKNPPNLAVDRTEVYSTGRGEAIKVIASIEDQVKMFLLALEKLPKVLEDINRLRAAVDKGKEDVELRGGAERPGFMDDDDDDEPEEPKIKKKATTKKKEEDNANAFDDDSFYEEKSTPDEQQKLLPPSEGHEDEGDEEWLNERD